MNAIPKWYDHYTVEKNRIILTEEQLHIPGLRMFGHHTSYNATQSLNWHYHENAFEFSLPSKGTFSFSTMDENFPFSEVRFLSPTRMRSMVQMRSRLQSVSFIGSS